MATNQQAVPSEWAPLRIAAFRTIWFASLAANVGTWFQNVGGVWLMTVFLPVLRLLEGVVEYEEATGILVTFRWQQRNR